MIRAAGLAALLLLGGACSKQPAQRRAPKVDGVTRHGDAAVPLPVGDDAAVVRELRPFRIEYRWMALMRCKGNRRMRIEDDGRVFAVEQATDCLDRATPFTTPYPAQPVRTLPPEAVTRLAAAVAASGLLALPDDNVNERAHDGVREELVLEIGGVPRTIAVQNLEVPAFSAVRELVLGAAP